MVFDANVLCVNHKHHCNKRNEKPPCPPVLQKSNETARPQTIKELAQPDEVHKDINKETGMAITGVLRPGLHQPGCHYRRAERGFTAAARPLANPRRRSGRQPRLVRQCAGAQCSRAGLLSKHKAKIDIGPLRHGITRGTTIYFFDPSGNRVETFCGGYAFYPDMRPYTWIWDEIGTGVFYHTRELNERFLTLVT